MTARIVIASSADADYAEILNDLAGKAGWRVAAKYDGLFERLYDRLADHPRSGALRPALGPDVALSPHTSSSTGLRTTPRANSDGQSKLDEAHAHAVAQQEKQRREDQIVEVTDQMRRRDQLERSGLGHSAWLGRHGGIHTSFRCGREPGGYGWRLGAHCVCLRPLT